MKKYLIGLYTAVILINCDNTTVEEYYNRAIEFEKIEDYETAIRNLNKAIEKDKFCRSALLNRGYYKSKIGDDLGGIEDYKKILEFDSNNTLALFNMATSYSNLENTDLALFFYSKALKTKGALNCNANSRGYMLFNTKFDTKRFDSDMEFTMPKCEIYFDRGLEYYWLEDYNNAISDFQKSLNSNNQIIDCYFLIGESNLAKNDTINACINYKEASILGLNAASEALNILCK
ncbi:hypothetical protein [uncultured Winogradskyella sp.]|uniref:tetratricopeptide repeat protein n=1 Tax=uncultured Winogradskyella sp. TaxID=395353 RepID=UPI00262B93B4|nr:hypothetical protein [uncultured Winogradskyella sp.]